MEPIENGEEKKEILELGGQPVPGQNMDYNDDAREKAVQFLREENQKKAAACWNELNQVLEKYGFQMSASTILSGDGRIMHRIDLV